MEYFILIVASIFATHRLTVLLNDDKITESLRNKLFDRWNPSNSWTYVFTCPWCMSIWIGFVVSALAVAVPNLWLIPALALAYSSITGLIEEKR